MVDILNELSIIVPNSAWIKTMDITGNLIKLQGEADAASELINLLESSSLFEDAKFLSTIVKRKDGKESFNIGLKLAAKTHE
jgi:general secretion pathway protein L